MAASLLTIGQWYLYAGMAVAAVFLTVGLGRIDENAQGAWIFRPLLIPGVLLLWPAVLLRWALMETGRAQHGRGPAHRVQGVLGLGLAMALPVIIFGALIIAQDGPYERRATQLEAPE